MACKGMAPCAAVALAGVDCIGSGLHLIGELFRSIAGIDMLHVPYTGVAQALPEMFAGKVQSPTTRFRPSGRTSSRVD